MIFSFDVSDLSAAELLALHGRLGRELRDRGICRTANNPTGDLAEFLFCRAFGWTQADNSTRAVDAISSSGLRYQIKGRRLTERGRSRQLGAIRDLAGGHFDFLAAVIFDADYRVIRAAIIPAAVVVAGATFVARTNSSKFFLRDAVWQQPGVTDVTGELRAVGLG